LDLALNLPILCTSRVFDELALLLRDSPIQRPPRPGGEELQEGLRGHSVKLFERVAPVSVLPRHLPRPYLHTRPRESLSPRLPWSYQTDLPSGRRVPRSARRFAGVLMPSASERVVDGGHRVPPHPRVNPPACPLRIVPRP